VILRSIEIPELKFSRWHYWPDRGQLPGISSPGIYMLSVTEQDLSGKVVRFRDVSYIGMTNSQAGLRGRWNQLNRSINGWSGHSGGNSIRKTLGVYDSWKNGLDLYVCAASIPCDVKRRSAKDLHLMGAICYLEYEAFLKFKRACPELGSPEFNTR
jgi:hypothetical protein